MVWWAYGTPILRQLDRFVSWGDPPPLSLLILILILLQVIVILPIVYRFSLPLRSSIAIGKQLDQLVTRVGKLKQKVSSIGDLQSCRLAMLRGQFSFSLLFLAINESRNTKA